MKNKNLFSKIKGWCLGIFVMLICIFINPMEVNAGYDLVKNPDGVVHHWNYEDALVNGVVPTKTENSDGTFTLKFTGGISYAGETYDLCMKVEAIDRGVVTNPVYNWPKTGGQGFSIVQDTSTPPIKAVSLKPTDIDKYTFEADVWIQDPNDGDKILTSADMPFVAGLCWMADNTTTTPEYARIYSNDGKYHNNLSFAKNEKNPVFWESEREGLGRNDTITGNAGDERDKIEYFYLGLGYKDSNNTTVRIGYSGTTYMEMRLGYLSYHLTTRVDDGSTGKVGSVPYTNEPVLINKPLKSNKPDKNYVADLSGVAPVTGNVITHWTTDVPIKVNGVERPANSIIYLDEIQAGNIELLSDTILTVYAVSDTATININYVNNGHGINPSPENGVPVGSVAKNNNSLSENGYVFGGWFLDPAMTIPYTGQKLYTDTTLYAKWTEVSTTPSTPEETETDTPPSTGETIKVEFVTPIGNPPPTQIKHVGDKADDPGAPIDPATLKPGTIIDGHRFEGWYLDKGFTMPYNFDTKLPHSIVLYAKWVRVSPKTGDTTIPPVYYVFGALALAGVGALATKSRKLRK